MKNHDLSPFGLLLVILSMLGSCQSAPTKEENARFEGAKVSTGPKDLAQIDMYLQIWNNRLLEEPSEQNISQMQAAEQSIGEQVNARFEDYAKLVESGPYWNRAIAVAAIGFGKDERALPYLIKALNDNDSRIISNALMGLGVLSSKDTPMEIILEILSHHTDRGVRNNAAFAMKRLTESGVRHPELLTSLREALHDPEPGVRAQAAYALGSLRDSEAVGALIPLLGDPKPLIASAAAFSLGMIRDPRSKEALISALESPSPRVRQAAHTALISITGEDRGKSAWDWKKDK